MPRKAKAARTYFRRRKGRPTKLVILHNGREYETGIGECSDGEAQAALAEYLVKNHSANTQERDQAKIAVGEVIMLYLEQHAPTTRSGPQIAAHAKAVNATVVTANIDEFKRVRGLKVENWLS